MTLKTVLGFALVALSLAWTFGPHGTTIALSAPPVQTGVVASPTPQTGDRTYVVESGDSFWTIAQKFYGDGSKYRLIIAANKLTETTRLQVGQLLVIPAYSDSAPFVPTVSFTPAPTGVFTAVPTMSIRATVTVTATNARAVIASPPAPTTSLGSSAVASPSSAILPPQVVSSIAAPDFLRVLDILSGILAGSSVVCAFFAYQAYVRAQRLERMMRVRRRSRVQL